MAKGKPNSSIFSSGPSYRSRRDVSESYSVFGKVRKSGKHTGSKGKPTPSGNRQSPNRPRKPNKGQQGSH
jgi:hypothetical protein